jgi:hypothetical protein
VITSPEGPATRPRPLAGGVVAGLVLLAAAACTSSPTADGTTGSSASVATSGSVSSAPASSAATPAPTGSSAAPSPASSAPATASAPASTAGTPAAPGTSAAPTSSDGEIVPTPTTISTPVPPPGGGGNVSSTVPTRAVATSTAVPLTAPATFAGGVTATVTSVRAVTATAVGPGEIGGPAVAVTVSLKNGSAAAVLLGNYFVSLTDSAKQAGISTTGDPARPWSGQLAPGQTASGVWVFTVPTANRAPVTITVSDAAGASTLTFTGTVA